MINIYPAPHQQTASTAFDGQTVIIMSDAGQVVVLNEVGSLVWSIADGSHPLTAIVEAVTDEFDTTLERADEDVRSFVNELVEKQILVLKGQEPEVQSQ